MTKLTIITDEALQKYRDALAENERLRSQIQDRGAWVTLEQHSREVAENERLRKALAKIAALERGEIGSTARAALSQPDD